MLIALLACLGDRQNPQSRKPETAAAAGYVPTGGRSLANDVVTK